MILVVSSGQCKDGSHAKFGIFRERVQIGEHHFVLTVACDTACAEAACANMSVPALSRRDISCVASRGPFVAIKLHKLANIPKSQHGQHTQLHHFRRENTFRLP